MLPDTLCFIDLETTGAHHVRDRVIEIGIVKVRSGRVIAKYETLINPQAYISPFIKELTGIDPDLLDRAPTFRQVSLDLEELLHDAVMVAHNVRFDYLFLKREFDRLEKRFHLRTLCTVKLSRLLFPRYKHHDLDSLIKRFSLPSPHRHRALSDAISIYSFFEMVRKKMVTQKFEQTVATLFKRPALPPFISIKVINELPQSPGVYIFYGENNLPIYIGKSKNIRERVVSHFNEDLGSNRERKLKDQLRNIEFIKTPGEMGALLLESQLIKTHLPLFNRHLRFARELIALKEFTDKNGYRTIQAVPFLPPYKYTLNSLISVCKSKKQMQTLLTDLCVTNSLCPQLMGIEKGKGPCFNYHLGTCSGACKGKESPLRYNLRFLQAISALRFKKWPFTGPIDIIEGTDDRVKDIFTVNKWCIVKKTEIREQDTEEFSYQPEMFDTDTYNILVKYIFGKNTSRQIHIRPGGTDRNLSLEASNQETSLFESFN